MMIYICIWTKNIFVLIVHNTCCRELEEKETHVEPVMWNAVYNETAVHETQA